MITIPRRLPSPRRCHPADCRHLAAATPPTGGSMGSRRPAAAAPSRHGAAAVSPQESLLFFSTVEFLWPAIPLHAGCALLDHGHGAALSRRCPITGHGAALGLWPMPAGIGRSSAPIPSQSRKGGGIEQLQEATALERLRLRPRPLGCRRPPKPPPLLFPFNLRRGFPLQPSTASGTPADPPPAAAG